MKDNPESAMPSLERVAVDLLNRLARADSAVADQRIDEALGRLGEVGGFDRTYLFWLRDGRFLDNTHEWAAPGIPPMIDQLQGLPVEAYGPLWDPFERDEHVYIPDVAAMPDEDATARDLLLEQDIASLLLVPVVDAGKPVGLVGYDAVAQPRRLSDGDILLLRAVANGIGSLKVRLGAELALRENRDLLAATLNALPDLILQTDREGRIAQVHPAADVASLARPERMRGKPLSEVLPPDLAQRASELMAASAAGAAPGPQRYPVTLAGVEHWFEARIAEWRSRAGGWVFIIRDITREHLAARQEETRIRQLQEIFTSSPIGIALSDAETGAVLDVNPAFLRDTGYHREACTGLRMEDVLAPDQEAQEKASAAMLCDIGRYGPEDRGILRADGTIAPVRMSGVLADHTGDRRAIWHFVDDQTERRAHEAEIIERRREAEAANRAKSAFLANMSHEIRTPMNGILGMAELLAESGLNDGQADMVATIRESGDALLTIINDILDLSRIEAGKISFAPEPFAPAALLRRLDSLHGASARLKGLSFGTDIGPGLDAQRIGDSHRLAQVLSNIIGNAIKFTETGSVRMEARAASDETLLFIISDTGPGMTDEQLRRVFGEFEQADNSITRRYGGSGLGLAISRKFLELMHGRIDMQSRRGVGTTVEIEVRMPLVADVRTTAPPSPALPSLPEGLRVLVAEDNRTNAAILAALLKGLGVAAEFATNGQEAVDLWRPGAFDLLLIDVSMPVMDGLEALSQIRARARESGESGAQMPPAIAVTANVMPSQISAYQDHGFAATLCKPYRRDDLILAMHNVLAGDAT